MPAHGLRQWQRLALCRWKDSGHRGIASVVTGGGKTIFALACVDALRPPTTLIVVPTLALIDQWWEECAAFFSLDVDDVALVSARGVVKSGTLNLAVLNTASKIDPSRVPPGTFLIVDECHKAAAPEFSHVLELPRVAALGLSATPERQYDDGLRELLIPALGPIIFEYTYRDALRDGVIVPFFLRNIVFDLEEERREQYDRLTKSIARAMRLHGPEAPETVALYLRRARVLNLSENRVKLALRLVASHRGRRTLVFHEDIEACNMMHRVLVQAGVRSGVYHSKLPVKARARMLQSYRAGELDVLVTCRALDEGFNVPETEVGIIAASTATRRQRIQRLGRVLRPASSKAAAVVYTLVASTPEIGRLQQEEAEMEGVASVEWVHA
jgi:superfamily II DNA or RNA helicase